MKKKKNRARVWHKWLGVPIAFFAFMFALSGVILNHREWFSGVDISRKYLPDYLRVDNWNLSSVKTTIPIGKDSLLMYGMGGIWLTDRNHSFVERFEKGLKSGADNRNIAKIVKTGNNGFFAVSPFDLYWLNAKTKIWENITSYIGSNERFMDIEARKDSLIVLSRSEVFVSEYPYKNFKKLQILPPDSYDGKVSLFKTFWRLHSGELFGNFGKIVVDILGIVTIILSGTGIIIFIFPKIVKRLKKRKKKVTMFIYTLRPSYKWHGKLGYWLVALILVLFISGTFLRPPLLISIIKGKTSPVPFSTLDSDNAWNDRLRCINYDTLNNEWLMYTSEGFFHLKDFKSKPEKIVYAPRVSVMGINIMKQIYNNYWMVGSFNGLVLWDRISGNCVDFITKQPIAIKKPGPPNEGDAITGYSSDFKIDNVAFSYVYGGHYIHSNEHFLKMPEEDRNSKISLWHAALEVHTGRIYKPIIGIVAELYIFLSGLILTIVTITGFVMYKRIRKKRQSKKEKASFYS